MMLHGAAPDTLQTFGVSAALAQPSFLEGQQLAIQGASRQPRAVKPLRCRATLTAEKSSSIQVNKAYNLQGLPEGQMDSTHQSGHI